MFEEDLYGTPEAKPRDAGTTWELPGDDLSVILGETDMSPKPSDDDVLAGDGLMYGDDVAA